MWDAIRYIGSPLTLAAFFAAAGVTVYAMRQKYKANVIQSAPEKDRVKMAEQVLERFHVNTGNLTRDQQFKIAMEQIRAREANAWRLALLFLAIAILAAAVVVIAVLFSDKTNEPKSTRLVLRLEEEGTNISQANGPQAVSGVFLHFALANPGPGLGSIDEMAVEVLDVIDDKWPTAQALASTYKYQAMLNPEKRGLVPFVKKTFKYATGDIDNFILNLNSEKEGYDYFIRIVVKWHDYLRNESQQTNSEVLVARFPLASIPEGMTRDEIGRRSEEQTERVEKHLQELRAKFPNHSG
jgi:hypothetical protein